VGQTPSARGTGHVDNGTSRLSEARELSSHAGHDAIYVDAHGPIPVHLILSQSTLYHIALTRQSHALVQ
jgi:hypothetical protein